MSYIIRCSNYLIGIIDLYWISIADFIAKYDIVASNDESSMIISLPSFPNLVTSNNISKRYQARYGRQIEVYSEKQKTNFPTGIKAKMLRSIDSSHQFTF